MTYPYEGLLMNQYQTHQIFGYDPAQRLVTGFEILNSLAISNEEFNKWENVLILLGWAVFYRTCFYLILRFGSKNQGHRKIKEEKDDAEIA
ncbi:hypothetical protein CRYUN_Cryun24cG0045500 [Craigia yunnanensis]